MNFILLLYCFSMVVFIYTQIKEAAMGIACTMMVLHCDFLKIILLLLYYRNEFNCPKRQALRTD
jgi:hypothetical protein